MEVDDKRSTFIFTFSRMNPPHPGHLKLIKTMIYKAIDLNMQKVFVFLSKTKDAKNPLYCKSENENEKHSVYKSQILNQMIPSYKKELISEALSEENKSKIENIEVVVECTPNISQLTTPITIFKDRNHKINTFMVVGSDRESFIKTFSKIFGKMDFIHEMDGMVLKRDDNTGSFDVNNIATYSASKIREKVKKGDKDAFRQIYSRYLEDSTINNLFDSIEKEMKKSASPKNNKRKSSAKSSPPSKKGRKSFKTYTKEKSNAKENSNNTKQGGKRKRQTKKKQAIITYTM